MAHRHKRNNALVAGAAGLSAPVIMGLLEWAGREMDAYYSTMDLEGDGQVGWASDGRVPIWFDIAQDLTERWVHQMQMREAVGRVEGYADTYRPIVLRTFVWALPHQYRVDASPSTTVQVDLSSGGRWHLTCEGSTYWSLNEGAVDQPDAHAAFSDDAGWRWLTGASLPPQGVLFRGPSILTEPLRAVRGILA